MMSSSSPHISLKTLETSTSHVRLCKTCNQPINSYSKAYVRCLRCRENARRYKKISKERRDAARNTVNLKVETYSGLQEGSENVILSSSKKKKADGVAKNPKPVKHNLPKPLAELHGMQKEQAMNMMMQDLEAQKVDTGNSKRQLHPINSSAEEYQTASELCDGLKLAVKRKSKISFDARFSIIPVSGINHTERVRMFRKDLYKLVRFNHSQSLEAKDRPSYCKRVYSCTCGSSVSRSNSKKKSNTYPIVNCGGRITVIAQDDKSHALGILGQMICVKIEHPGQARRIA